MVDSISNFKDLIDSRDVIERIDDLETDEDRTTSEDEELAALKALASEASDYAADWEYGGALIRGSYFEKYAQDLAEDVGAIDRDAAWPTSCIDWGQAARELQMDYTCVDFDGVEYWIR